MTKREFLIKTTLYKLGITPDSKGYYYLTEAISEKLNKKKEDCKIKTIELYDKIAEKFNSKRIRVERMMRYAIEKSFDYMKPLYLEIFGFEEVTVTCFIAMVAEYIEFKASTEIEEMEGKKV